MDQVRIPRIVFLMVWITALLGLGVPAVAADRAPKVVRVGAYMQSLHAMSLKDNSFTIDFYLWFRWSPEEWKSEGGEPPKLPFESFEVVGASEVEKEVQQQEDGYAALRVKAHLTQFWNVEKFPLDNHVLRIVVEDVADETDLLVYAADSAASSIAPGFVVPGWKTMPVQVRTSEHEYHTTFGDPKLEKNHSSFYSQIIFDIPVVREGYGMFLKLFTGLFVSVMIALVSFFIRATEVDPRFGLPVGALFAAIASEYVVASTLPDSSAVTLADSLHLVSFLAILAVVIVGARSLHLLKSEQDGVEGRVKRLDRMAFVLVACLWTAAVALLTVSAVR